MNILYALVATGGNIKNRKIRLVSESTILTERSVFVYVRVRVLCLNVTYRYFILLFASDWIQTQPTLRSADIIIKILA